MSSTGTESTAERAMGVYAVRPADQATDASAGTRAVTHAYDGSMNDGFCECGLPRDAAIHAITIEPWEYAWKRALTMQGRMTPERLRMWGE